MTKIAFNKLGTLTSRLFQSYQVQKPDNPCDNETININTSGLFTFDPSINFTCKKMIIMPDVNVQITGMHLKGCLVINAGADVETKFCEISSPGQDIDYIVEIKCAKLVAKNCTFYDSEMYGISVDDGAYLSMEGCHLHDCLETPLAVTGRSTIELASCTIDKTESDCAIADNSTMLFKNVEFKKSEQSGIRIFNESKIIVQDCKFKDNNYGALSSKDCNEITMKDSDIFSSNDTAIILDCSSGIFQNLHIKKINGNCLNASSHSNALVYNCHFEDSQWPLVAFCDNSSGIVQNSVFERSLMSGFIVRGSEHLIIEGCTIRTCAETGLRVTNSRDITIKNTCIGDAQYSSLEACDLANVVCKDCIIAGGARNGIGVFTGGRLTAVNCTAIGPYNTALWVHHGGEAFLSGFVYAPSPSPIKKGEWMMFANAARLLKRAAINDPIVVEKYTCNYQQIIQDERKEILTTPTAPNDQRICRVDTKWGVEISNGYVVGVGNYELHANTLNKRETIEYPSAPCLNCGSKGQHSNFCPCGHALYCKDCWESMKEEDRPKLCPLCHLPIEKALHQLYQIGEDGNTCPICYTNECDCIITPCGHKICHQCSSHWFKTSYECPFCREAQARTRPLLPYE